MLRFKLKEVSDLEEHLADLETRLSESKKKQEKVNDIIESLGIDEYIYNLYDLSNKLNAELYEEPVLCKLNNELIVSVSLDDGSYWLDIHKDYVVLKTSQNGKYVDASDKVKLPETLEFCEREIEDVSVLRDDEYYNYMSIKDIMIKFLKMVRVYMIDLPQIKN